MADNLDRLTDAVRAKLRRLDLPSPRASVLRELLNITYFASLKTEEGRFVRGSVTFANPANPDINPPLTRRASYPGFTSFGEPLPLTVETLVKLSRAIDRWSASIAVYGTSTSHLVAWGVLDQLVGHNVSLHRESHTGFSSLGIITVGMDGVGELSVCHGDLFLGALRQDRLVKQENDALRSKALAKRIIPYLIPIAARIAKVDGIPTDERALTDSLFDLWSTTVARLCIGLRRMGTGGSFLMSPNPNHALLELVHPFPYHRLCSAAVLHVLDTEYLSTMSERLYRSTSQTISRALVLHEELAEADAEDREHELTGAVKLVTSLAAVDGLVLLNPLLKVVGFGTKIKSGSQIGKIYDGPDFARKGTVAKTIDPSRFGTRHGSIFGYCRRDPRSLAIVVSQDGQVRLILTTNRCLTLWDDVKLLGHEYDVRHYARILQTMKNYRDRHRNKSSLGYTSTPKTLDDLLG